MNILIIGLPLPKLVNLLKASKRISKLYTATTSPMEGVPNIEFDSFDNLVYKSRLLGIDIAITTDSEFLQYGIADIFKQNHLPIIAVNKKWFNLEASNFAAKQLLNHYVINIPTIVKAPIVFPLVLRTDEGEKIVVSSMQNLVESMKNLAGRHTFLEEYLDGEFVNFTFLWDGATLLSSSCANLNEVQEDRFELFKTKLNFMLSDEKADFIGFFDVKLIWAKNDWYVLDFRMRLNEDSNFNVFEKDLVYILNLAIYQKLNEIV